MPIKRKLLRKLVHVIWIDSEVTKAWVSVSEPLSHSKIHTFGILTRFDKILLEIASTIAEDGETLNPLRIPIGCVISIKEIKQ
jgi:hypothetical protein